MEKPEKKFSTGAISVAIWKNQAKSKEGQDGEYYTVSLQRSYKDKNDKWQTTSSLRVNDLPKASLVINKAFEYLVLRENAADEMFEEIVM